MSTEKRKISSVVRELTNSRRRKRGKAAKRRSSKNREEEQREKEKDMRSTKRTPRKRLSSTLGLSHLLSLSLSLSPITSIASQDGVHQHKEHVRVSLIAHHVIHVGTEARVSKRTSLRKNSKSQSQQRKIKRRIFVCLLCLSRFLQQSCFSSCRCLCCLF